ncbi:MAG: ATP synthase F1 subunit gamma [Firmicutes bacterium]|nr:ATP synthase F1 subunit gamma [Bacillota bacterium]
MAASNMRDIKRRIRSISSMEHITKAMKLVSSAKLRKAKANFERTQGYLSYVTESIKEVFRDVDEAPADYLAGTREIKRTCYIVVTSCRGLCGSYNSNVIKAAQRRMDESDSQPVLVTVGSKGKDYFARRNYEICQEYDLPPEDMTFQMTQSFTGPILEMYKNGEVDEIVLIYTAFKSTLEYEVKTVKLLPFEFEAPKEGAAARRQVEYAPSIDQVFNYMIPKYAELTVFGSIIEAATCEHAARRMAMEAATDNANEMLSELSLTYNRARQAAITNEISEIVGGAEALA